MLLTIVYCHRLTVNKTRNSLSCWPHRVDHRVAESLLRSWAARGTAAWELKALNGTAQPWEDVSFAAPPMRNAGAGTPGPVPHAARSCRCSKETWLPSAHRARSPAAGAAFSRFAVRSTLDWRAGMPSCMYWPNHCMGQKYEYTVVDGTDAPRKMSAFGRPPFAPAEARHAASLTVCVCLVSPGRRCLDLHARTERRPTALSAVGLEYAPVFIQRL